MFRVVEKNKKENPVKIYWHYYIGLGKYLCDILYTYKVYHLKRQNFKITLKKKKMFHL